MDLADEAESIPGLSHYSQPPHCRLCATHGLAVKQIGAKGRGLVAVGRSIPPGEALIQEVPETASAGSDEDALQLLAQRIVDAGPSGRFAHLCTLSRDDEGTNEPSQEIDRAREQVKANGFGGRQPSGRVCLSLFSVVSFCNHSCAPNAALSRREGSGSGERTLYSVREILPGDEVTICYDSALLWLPEPARRLRISDTWRFLCTCSRCEAERLDSRLDSFTDIDRYFDAKGQLTSGVVMRPSSLESDTGPNVVDIYEEAHEFFGPSHWRTHAAREAALRVILSDAAEEFDFDMLLEHLQQLLQIVPSIHPHFLTWYTRLQQVLASDGEAIMRDRDWRSAVERLQAPLSCHARVLQWNRVPPAVTLNAPSDGMPREAEER